MDRQLERQRQRERLDEEAAKIEQEGASDTWGAFAEEYRAWRKAEERAARRRSYTGAA